MRADWSRALLVAAAVAPACANRPPQSQKSQALLGTRADLRTSPGPHDGFAFEIDCREPDCVGVEGRGSRALYPGADVADEAARMSALREAQADLERTVRGLRSVDMTADGQGCRRSGLILWLHDWREADVAVARIGGWLKRDDLADEVTVCIWPGPMENT